MLEDGAWFTLVGSMCVGECKKTLYPLSCQLCSLMAMAMGIKCSTLGLALVLKKIGAHFSLKITGAGAIVSGTWASQMNSFVILHDL